MKKSIVLLISMVFINVINAQSHHWTPISGNQYNMTVTGVIVIDNVVQTVTTLEIGAFCGDECRASFFPQFFPPTDDYVVTMTIRSRVINNETITFKLYDHLIQEELDLECLSTIEFEANAVIGNASNWYQFAFESQGIHTINPGSWSDPNIWNTPPDATSSVIIENNCTVDIDVAVAALTVNDGAVLTIKTGKTLTVNGSLVNGNENGLVIEDGAQVINESAGVKATAHKDIQAYTMKDSNGWHLIASPVNDMAIAGSDFVTETYDLYRYDEPTYTWENYRYPYNVNFDTFENGRGYLYANSNSGFSPAFTGDLNYAAVLYEVSFASPGPLKGFNLIGNPFPHNIYKGAGGAIDNNKLASGYYTLSYNGEWVAHAFEDEIAPGQGVLVETTAATDIIISKTNAEATAETLSKDVVKRLKINVSGNGRSDRAYAYFSEGIGLDKMDPYSSSAAQIAVRDGENDYAIAHVGEDCEEMNVIFKNTKNGYYTVTFEGLDDFEYLHLIDNVLGIETDMKQEAYYKFHALGNEDENRFKVVCKDYSGIGENLENSAFSYISGNNIVVTGEGTLQIIDMTGRVINTTIVNGAETIEKPSQNGVYVLRIVNGNNVKTQKIVVR